MSSLLAGIGSISGIILGVTLFIVAIVKLITYLIGKPLTTPNQRTRKLLFVEFTITMVSFLLQFLGAGIHMVIYQLSNSPTMDTVLEILLSVLFICLSLFIYITFIKKKRLASFYVKGILWSLTTLLSLYSAEVMYDTLRAFIK